MWLPSLCPAVDSLRGGVESVGFGREAAASTPRPLSTDRTEGIGEIEFSGSTALVPLCDDDVSELLGRLLEVGVGEGCYSVKRN